IHMEEDAGKLFHDAGKNQSYVDFNRAGIPLLEIVSEPDMHSAKEVVAYLEKLRLIIQYLGVSDCKMQEGSMRADVNISVRKRGERKLGTRCEMKNLNSFKAITRAIEHESLRQIGLLEAGESVTMETRRFDDARGCSFSMRSKEDARDYRYFPDPDLPPFAISREWVESVRARQPELRAEKMLRYKREFDLPDYDIEILTGSKALADLFEQCERICHQPKKVSNWLMGETIRLLKLREMDPDELHITPANLAKLILLVENGTISNGVAKQVFEIMFDKNIDPESYVNENKLGTIRDEGHLRVVCMQVIEQHPQSVQDYRSGKKKAIGFLVGQTMKEMSGKADAKEVSRLLAELLEE
ncbi:MAG: Asp-tRNA(Asn)/Glu-tRNA(Gln) amidotransferase subunit GatB, partial [Lachnospiraceae bacterium]|nr:Asp-tRNA(Asn)/Glu-tRNA(Gln) amidotransferase subunit GatB [Lachnospiraceae bacterium]